MTEQAEPVSPCVDICALDEEDTCVGCYRTAREITDWGRLDHDAKWRVLDNARQRRRQAGVLL